MTARQIAARRPRGKTAHRRQVNTRATFWTEGEFIAIDGEGFSDGEPFDVEIGSNQTRYTGKGHSYAYLAASDGSERYNPAGRLGLVQCLGFLCSIMEKTPLAQLVVFGGSYDVTHMLAHDLDRDQLARLIGKSKDNRPCIVSPGDGYTYKLDYRPRKCLTIQRWPEGVRRWEINSKGKRVLTKHLTVRLWDVWGFFQDSFVGVMEKWVPDDPDYQMIRRMKGDRSIFDRSEIDDIRRYNAAELRILVKIMNRVRDAINDLGLKITRWDGAGAVAAAMMSKHKVKEHKGESNEQVFQAIRMAYSGGHIEAAKIGHWRGKVFHYDINSAYPDQFRRLPSLSGGRWVSGNSGTPPPGYSIVRVKFHYPPDLPFYPLFYRCEDGAIFYPHRGRGWYWWSEYDVARQYYTLTVQTAPDLEPCEFTVLEWHHFRAASDERPFAWVEDYYLRRQDYIRTARARGYVSGPEKIIKLGLNALYGKTAQQVGARHEPSGELRLPPFFQLDWAGYVTAGCRARMMEAAIQKPHAIIMFATDGLFSTEPLDLDCPDEKVLGAWEKTEHDGITVVMPGVYWLHDGEKLTHYSRGFDKAEMSSCDFIHQAWRERKESVAISLTRMIGIGSALASKDYWRMRGCFATGSRRLVLDGRNSKREGLDLAGKRLDLQLYDLEPRDHVLVNSLGLDDSAPYPIAWLDGNLGPGFRRDVDLDADGDIAEELEQMDAELA